MSKFTQKKMAIRELVQLHKMGKLEMDTFHREFIFNQDQQDSVIDFIAMGIPMMLYFAPLENDSYEVIDGKQRIMSIVNFVNSKMFSERLKSHKESLLNYEIDILVCDANSQEKVEMFQRANSF